MKTIKGDLIKLAKAGKFDVIVHGANCFCKMGAGVALQIRKEFPDAFEIDQVTKIGYRGKLGKYTSTYFEVDNGVILRVINAYTQYDYRGPGRKADYKAIRSVFREIKKDFSGHKIGFPYIGAGLAGGNWNIISKIIKEELAGEDFTLVEYVK
jgi:O-acetyl-ADP-ribose deacetylase (regulator of RNase III)